MHFWWKRTPLIDPCTRVDRHTQCGAMQTEHLVEFLYSPAIAWSPACGEKEAKNLPISVAEAFMHLSSIAAAVVVLLVTGSFTRAHAQSVESRTHDSTTVKNSPKIYEDREIKVRIPSGWRILSDSEVKDTGSADSLGNSVSQGEGKLILRKNAYILGLAYNTGHASGIEGGRFIEIFNIPWPGADDAWDCSLYLSEYPQPASRVLMFTNVVANPNKAGIGEHCGVKIDSRAWGDENGAIRRWFGGYFTTAEGGYFFDLPGKGCGGKAYTFTFHSDPIDFQISMIALLKR